MSTPPPPPSPLVDKLATCLALGDLLEMLRALGGYELLEHWTQGEFHHDVVVRAVATALPGPILVVATNCNGGVKEVLCFAEPPARGALWHWRCPDISEFSGDLPAILARATTVHYFDPCELLGPDARSELRPEFRQRQAGGGWEPR
jgi:hypothetical protein